MSSGALLRCKAPVLVHKTQGLAFSIVGGWLLGGVTFISILQGFNVCIWDAANFEPMELP